MTPQQLVLGRVQYWVDDWKNFSSFGYSIQWEYPSFEAREELAFEILSCWAHLRRFDPATLDDELVKTINTLVEKDSELLCKSVLYGRFPYTDRACLKNFVAEVEKHDESWDYPMSDLEYWEAAKGVRDYWNLLDNWSLVAYAIKKLVLYQWGEVVGKLLADEGKSLVEDVEKASNFVIDRPDVLLHAACGADSMYAAYREDLHAFDEELAETTLKHFALVELHEEQQRT